MSRNTRNQEENEWKPSQSLKYALSCHDSISSSFDEVYGKKCEKHQAKFPQKLYQKVIHVNSLLVHCVAQTYRAHSLRMKTVSSFVITNSYYSVIFPFDSNIFHLFAHSLHWMNQWKIKRKSTRCWLLSPSIYANAFCISDWQRRFTNRRFLRIAFGCQWASSYDSKMTTVTVPSSKDNNL